MHVDSHSHSHSIQRDGDRKRLWITLVLIAGYLVAEVVGAYFSNSLALLADAGHMLSDAAALGLSLFAITIARRPADPRRTFGYHRAEIMAALVNGTTLVAIALVIFWKAYERLHSPPEVMGGLLMVVATGGLLVNLVALWVLESGRTGNLNVRGAWLHVMTDALGSVGAILAGVFIWAFDWRWADPVMSVLIGLLVIYSSVNLLREAVSVLMESTPDHLDTEKVREAMLQLPGVLEVHKLHIWTITTGMVALCAHVKIAQQQNGQQVLEDVSHALHDLFEIDNITIQIETEGSTTCV
ncbi:MAG: cation diffusion facilitator family transporter [Planctomycetota bacterium]|nr:cation diffusion facilitator family transporter [Planctomycetota bacterium]